ncbi:MAG: 50S ribosomal protein L2 [Candidatus Pacearchaeota archaeon]|nr:50S ribosomal protein L2 [Candidatus Pacearchaeota archaeon]
MGKRIISQARGHGSLTYQAKKKSFIYKIQYPQGEGEAEIQKIIHSAAHSAPLIKAKLGKEIFFIPAFNNAFEGQKIMVGGNEIKDGNILMLKNIPVSSNVYNIERNPGDGGKIIRTSGSFAIVSKKLENNKVSLIMPNKKEVIFDGNCRATLGIIAGGGRVLKPFMTAGRKFYKMKTRNKLWPRTSAVKMNIVDHPFGSGRGKRIKSKIAKRNAPAGAKVGHLRPRRTGRRK